jgi:hypothetical protein
MDAESRKFVIVLGTSIAAIIIIIFLWQSLQYGSWLMPESPQGPITTPVITMSSEKTGSLNYTFTIAAISFNYNVAWGDILVNVHPDPISIEAPNDTDLISSGDEVIITFSSGTETVISLMYEPTELFAYQLVFTPLN